VNEEVKKKEEVKEVIMGEKNDRPLTIKQQIIKDLPSGLTIIFEVVSSGEGRMRLRGSNLPFGNRDFQFDSNGELVGTGTGLAGCGIYEEEGELHDEG